MKNFIVAAAMAACLPLTAQAGAYVGGVFGISQFDYDDIEDGKNTTLVGGYQLDKSNVYFEGAYFDTGKSNVTNSGGFEVGVKGYSLSAGYNFPLNSTTGSGFYVKGGLYSSDFKASGGGNSVTDDGTGVTFGLGGDWMLTKSFGLRADLTGLIGVKDFADDKNVTLFGGGIVYKFGAGM